MQSAFRLGKSLNSVRTRCSVLTEKVKIGNVCVQAKFYSKNNLHRVRTQFQFLVYVRQQEES